MQWWVLKVKQTCVTKWVCMGMEGSLFLNCLHLSNNKLSAVLPWAKSSKSFPPKKKIIWKWTNPLIVVVCHAAIDDEGISVESDLIAQESVYCNRSLASARNRFTCGRFKSIWTAPNSQLQHLTNIGQMFTLVPSQGSNVKNPYTPWPLGSSFWPTLG